MSLHSKRKSKRAFTLIEMMIAIALIGIIMAKVIPEIIQMQKLGESQVALQKAVRALENQAEIIRAAPADKLMPGVEIPFDPSVKNLEDLVAGRGVIKIEQDKNIPGLLLIRLEVHWRDPRLGMRSIHTIIMRASHRRED